MRRFIIALVASLFKAMFWWIVFVSVYASALFAGDRNSAAAPASDNTTIATSLAIIGGAVLLYAVLCLAWQGLTERIRRR